MSENMKVLERFVHTRLQSTPMYIGIINRKIGMPIPCESERDVRIVHINECPQPHTHESETVAL